MLKVTSLTKIFKKTEAIQGKKNQKKTYEVGIRSLSFEANAGKIFGLIGANGAGKTTAMRILAGITNAQSGKVEYKGQNIKDIRNYKAKVAFVSGETQPYERLTPFETMKLFATLAGVDKAKLDKEIKKIADSLDMNSFLNTPMQNFSTGMRQKVSIARALVTNPEIMIFDEITNGLDIFAHRAIIDIIKSLSTQGKVVIFSTHILNDADEICDDIALIHKGKIIETGRKKEILSKYQASDISELFFKAIKHDTV